MNRPNKTDETNRNRTPVTTVAIPHINNTYETIEWILNLQIAIMLLSVICRNKFLWKFLDVPSEFFLAERCNYFYLRV